MNKLISIDNVASSISRREFLRFCGLGLVGLVLPERLVEDSIGRFTDDSHHDLFGRVTRPGQELFDEPDVESEVIEGLVTDSVRKITGVTVSESDPSPNRIWYELDGQGFSHSRYIQPVYNIENKISTVIPEDGCLGEVTVPFVDAYRYADENSPRVYRLYYGSTYWVLKYEKDQVGKVWYQLLDDRNYNYFYVPAIYVRMVQASELLPISPDIPWEKKHIEVDLSKQTMTAFEGEKVVFMSRISSGRHSKEGGFLTPTGYYRTTRKRPCRHMANLGNDSYIGFDLPGVPWVSYFTSNGVAFHGTYWHNDYGVPHSHGCINLTPDAAKWVYRWTTPAVPFNEYIYKDDNGTRVIVY
jgi:hypothetical protein